MTMASTITTTLGALVDVEEGVLRLLSVKFDKADGARLRDHVVKLAKLVAAETKRFYDGRNALIEKYGEGEPKSLTPKSPHWATFSAELQALADARVSIPVAPLTSACVEPYPEIVGADLMALGPFYQLDAADGDDGGARG